MKVKDCVGCTTFSCADVRHDCYLVPDAEIDPTCIRIVMIAEAAPGRAADYFYAGADALFAQTTLLAFRDAGVQVNAVADLIDLGIYLTTAVKCGKTGYSIATSTIRQCSLVLEQELALFTNARVLMAMGDVAIKAVNDIARRQSQPRPVPAGSTYKIRGQAFWFRDTRVLPSYLQAGPSFFIEKSKRKVIAEDIASALRLVG